MTVSPALSGRGPRVDSGLERLIEACEALIPVPVRHRERSIGPDEAAKMLGISDSCGMELLREVLPHEVIDGDLRYEYCDIANVALAADRDRAIPVIAEGMVLRYSTLNIRSWTKRMLWKIRWRIDIEASAPARLPDAALLEGYTRRLTVDGCPREPGTKIDLLNSSSVIEADVELEGRVHQLVSSDIQELYRDTLADLNAHRLR